MQIRSGLYRCRKFILYYAVSGERMSVTGEIVLSDR